MFGGIAEGASDSDNCIVPFIANSSLRVILPMVSFVSHDYASLSLSARCGWLGGKHGDRPATRRHPFACRTHMAPRAVGLVSGVIHTVMCATSAVKKLFR